jgi:hypothetical protein
MGNVNAEGFAEAVAEGYASLRQAVAANLQSNHFPPIPVAYVDPVISAIDAANDDDSTRLIPLPDNLAYWHEGRDVLVIPASDLLDITHSWGFTSLFDDDTED